MSSPAGESREAVAYSIVLLLAKAEGKITMEGSRPPTFDRDWLRDAFAFAASCLGGWG